MKTKSTFLVRKALASPTLVHGSLHGEGPVLPSARPLGQSQLNKSVIWWMSVKSFPLLSIRRESKV